MKYLVYELFSGVGFCNQLFSLETAIYLANISNRKLILFIKNPLCHCGSSSWNYGKFMEFFSNDYLKYLPNGIEVHYGRNIPMTYSNIINDKDQTKHLIFGNRFSQLGFVDNDIFTLYHKNVNNINIKHFLNGRKPVILDIGQWTTDYIYLTESSAARCFSNFLTTSTNYQIMSNICESLTHLHESFYYIYKEVQLPDKYIGIHFRFGDSRISTQEVNNRCSKDTSHLINTIEKYNDDSKNIIIMSDRKDTEYLNNIQEKFSANITYTEDMIKNIDFNKYISNISDFKVVSFLIQKYICDLAKVFIGFEGSTVSHYIQYMNYINNKSYIHYTNRDIKICHDQPSWCINGIPGGGIGWKLFFSDNIFLNKLKIITLTNNGYTDLTDNLMISMKKIGLEKMLKIYCIGKESYEYFKNKYCFNEVEQVDTNETYLNNWVEYKAQQNKDVEGKKQWATITSYKIYAINNELRLGNDTIFIDGDIVFEKDPFKYMLDCLDPDTELLVQNDQQKGMTPAMCTGFFWMKSNENTINITNFDTITKNIDSFQNDQQYMRRFAKKIKHKYLDLDLFPNGKYFRDIKPDNPYIIHFNYDVSEFKIKRMKQFNKWYLDTERASVFQIPKLISSNTVLSIANKDTKHTISNDNSICKFLDTRNIHIKQGYITQVNEHSVQVIEYINKLCDVAQLQNILEIGFLAGHSAEMFLSLNKTVKVTSIDECVLQSIRAGKDYIDLYYPGRHSLIKGNSNNILKDDEFNNSQIKYDIILIDGSFKYDVIKQDILLSKTLAHENTILIINGIVEKKEWIKYWNTDHTLITTEMIDSQILNKIIQLDIDLGRGSLLCKYNIE